MALIYRIKFVIYMLNKYRDVKIINLDKLTYAGNLENLKSVENNENYVLFKEIFVIKVW